MTKQEALEAIDILIEMHENAIRDLQNDRNKIILSTEKEKTHE